MYKDWKIVADCIEKVRHIKAKPPFKISKGDYLNLIYIYIKNYKILTFSFSANMLTHQDINKSCLLFKYISIKGDWSLYLLKHEEILMIFN